jgi:hypothetical protein
MAPERSYPEHPPRDAFAASLEELYVSCSVTSLGQIVQMCKRLPTLYPDIYPPGKPAPCFVKSTISNILRGKRQGLPDPHWVTAYVLCCQAIAKENGLPDPGIASLARWQERLRRREEESQAAGLYVRRGYRPESRSQAPDPFRAATSQREPPAPPASLTTAQQTVVLGYAPYGLTLLQRLPQGDPEAIYQCALLLAGDRGGSQDAVNLLTNAASTNHPRALELLEASPRLLDQALARRHTRQLAEQAELTGYGDAAQAFTDCLARMDALTWSDDPRTDRRSLPQNQPPR